MGEERHDTKKSSQWSGIGKFIKTIPGMLTAIAASLTAIVAIMGVIGIVGPDTGTGAPAGPGQAGANTTSSSLPGSTTIPTSPSTAPTTTAGPAGVFRETGGAPVVLGSCLDLDSQEPNWGVGLQGHKDVCVSSWADSVNARLAVVRGTPTLEICQAQTDIRRSTTKAQTVLGQNLCVRSSEGRWAYLRIADIDTSAYTISFDIVVWKLADDP